MCSARPPRPGHSSCFDETVPARRWDLTPEEEGAVRRARAGILTPRVVAKGLFGSPQAMGDAARALLGGMRAGVLANNSLISLLDVAAVRQAVPDAALGVGWYDAGEFLAVLRPHLDPTSVVLELGCGGGRISRHVAPLVGRLVCTDPALAMTHEARENLAAFPNVEVARTSGRGLGEFAQHSFDVVFAQGVMGYLDPNPLLAMLDEVHRVLRPGGVCVFNFLTIDHPEDGRELLETVRGQARRARLHGGTDRAYTAAYLRALHQLAGLTPLRPGAGAQPEGQRGRVVLAAQRQEGEGK
jgi:SAM-dependent methyltransferase